MTKPKVSTSGYGALIWFQRWEIAHVSLTNSDMRPTGGFYPILCGCLGLYGTKDGRASLQSSTSRPG